MPYDTATASNPSSWRSVAAHAAAGALFSLFAIWLTYPLAWHLGTHLPGGEAGDNVTFLWNVWWFREWAAGRAAGLFFTDRLFAPFGTPLVLNTHTVLPSAIAWLVPAESVIVQHNIALIAGLAANGIAAYALAFRHVRQAAPSVAAGLVFGGSAYVCAHLSGHFNLVHAWVLPLGALAWLRFVAAPGPLSAVAFGGAVAAAAYTDYYYLVFLGLFAVVWIADASIRVAWTWQQRSWTRTLRILLVADLAVALVVLAIAMTGGFGFEVLGQRVSVRTIRNPLTLLYVLLLSTAIYALRPRVSVAMKGVPAGIIRGCIVALAATLILTLPISLAAIDLFRAGDYVAQQSHWRSSPPGVDVLTTLTGHPMHLVSGGVSRHVLQQLGIDVVEQVAWVGLIVLAIVWWNRAARAAPLWSFWAVVAVVFATLAAGPFLRIAGMDTGLPLPWAGLRYVFPFSNARIPGRAIVMTGLAVAMLLGYGLASARRARLLLVGLVAFELLPAPVPLYELPRPDAVDAYLRDHSTPGAVAELPAGLRDGFGVTGRIDHRALVHQLHHGRPIVGGFVARLSPRIADAYAQDARLTALLELSAGRPVESPNASPGLPFLVMNSDVLRDPALPQMLLRAGYVLVESAGTRHLYRSRSER